MVASVGNRYLPTWVHDLQQQVIETFSGPITTNSLRLVAIIGGYLLLRSRFFRLVSRHQASQLHQHPQSAPMPSISHIAGSPGSEDEDEGEEAGWGCRARRRQRHAITKSVDA
ncbi:MAG: hypothetical protein ALECFALPRED_004558 [Alectoria fallacina]|uniref:Uncharacterized protein n=1 Tax=Alectoria fallacina TaxID=1903189 RepID=A0A8H3FQA0_9LECA|nr:MAG: hypothetical protein ALECFALPRED_004558 [Alectoria fallacina]